MVPLALNADLGSTIEALIDWEELEDSRICSLIINITIGFNTIRKNNLLVFGFGMVLPVKAFLNS